MPCAVAALSALGDDAGEMQDDAMGLVHDEYHFWYL
jgi:hypothetical protein